MQSHNRPGSKKRWFRVGPGLLLALIVAGAILASGKLFNKMPADPGTGSIVWEADAHGHLHRVNAPTTPTQGVLPRIWKPEVRLLSQSASPLHLTAAQRTRLAALDTAWQREKAQIEAEMSQASADARAVAVRATPERAASATQIMQRLGDYSTLSAQYDVRRTAYWVQGYALLSPEQQRKMERLTKAARRGE